MIEIVILSMYIVFHYYNVNNLKEEVSEYYNKRREQKKIKTKVYDISFKYLPNLEKYEYLSDITTILIIIPIIFYPKIFKEYIGFWIVIFLIRSMTIRLTVLPKSNNCESNKFINLGTCYEKIFSGHFSSVLLATILYYKYNIIDIQTLSLLNIINGGLIILTRHHYTIDIVVAFFVTLFVYQNNLSINRIFN
jgi:hypothetical protein